MTAENKRVLVINPGSTSTKIGVYRKEGAEFVRTISHADEEVERFKNQPMIARLGYRADLIERALVEAGFAPDCRFAAVAGRGGLLPPMECGTYLVDDVMVGERIARNGESTRRTLVRCWRSNSRRRQESVPTSWTR